MGDSDWDVQKTHDMVFDYAESNGDDDEPVRPREGGVGVLDVVVWGPRGAP